MFNIAYKGYIDMKDFIKQLDQLQSIADKYNVSIDTISLAREELSDFRVTVPLVGAFSTGKSSLINAVMNEKLLSVNITPETAVATEIVSGSDKVILICRDESRKELSLTDFDNEILSADEHKLVHIETSNEFLKTVPSLKLVDMPGFDSGNDVHNRAIDEYMLKSLAYVLAVSADEGTLRESIIAFLNELKLYNVPVYAVITKAEKVDKNELGVIKDHIIDTIKRFMKVDDVKVAVTNSKGKNVYVSEFEDLLHELQKKSEDIGNQHFEFMIGNICSYIEKYLADCIGKSDMTLDQLKYEGEQHKEKILQIDRRFELEKERFSRQIDKCIETIKSKISSELQANSSTLESMILSGNNISEKINYIVRNAVASGIQSELEPQVKKYMKNVSELVSISSFENMNVDISDTQKNRDQQLLNTINTAAGPAITAVAIAIGTAIAPGIGTAIGAALGAVVSIFAGSMIEKKQQEERRRIAVEKVSKVISSITSEAASSIEVSIRSYTDQVNEHIAADINREREIEEKALTDAMEKLRLGTEEREKQLSELQYDLEVVRGISNVK